jgi:Fe-S cluster assembly scaffold protein SufB
MSGGVKWNIFARELENILTAHGSRIGKLNDIQTIALHPQAVSRLQASLAHPTSFVLINPDDLDRIIKEFTLSDAEQLRLRAAVLATAVERVLMDRIDPDTALMAADGVFHILLTALRERPDLAKTLRGSPLLSAADQVDAVSLEAAFDALDQAMIDLHLACQSPVETQPQMAFQALQGFEAATVLFGRCSAADQLTDEWQYGRSEAQRGSDRARALYHA